MKQREHVKKDGGLVYH